MLCFRLLNHLSEKETEYQELLRNSLWRKQQQIDALRKESVNEGNVVLMPKLVTSYEILAQ